MQPPHFRSRFFWGVNDPDGFDKGLDGLGSAARVKQGWFMSDNMIAFGRFWNDLGGQAFKVTNPNATAGCGCGTSFSV